MMVENFFVIYVHHREKTLLQLLIIMISYHDGALTQGTIDLILEGVNHKGNALVQ